MTTLLFDLGASREDVIKALPNFEEMSRRVKNKKKNDEASSSASGEPKAKRSKVCLYINNFREIDFISRRNIVSG